MGSTADQRHVPTARLRLGETAPPPEWEAMTDELAEAPTDPSGNRVPEVASPWRLNALGVVLATALICALLVAGALWVKLSRTRADLAEAEAAAEMAEAALAQETEAAPDGAKPGAKTVESILLAPGAQAAAPAEPERLVLLLTVGTQHYAEKQLRALKKKCGAPLSVYRQKRGRCAWSQCFAVAVPAAEADAARTCGTVKGQALRDRADFVVP